MTDSVWIIIARAADADPHGRNAQVKITVAGTLPPTDEEMVRYHDAIKQTFRWSFGDAPQRSGVAVLPYVSELDEEETDG